MSQLEQSTVPETPAQEEGPPAAPSPLWRWLTVALLILGLLLTVLFALRATRSFRTFHDERGRPPREATGNIEPWMTIPYVAAAYDVPEEFLYAQLGLDGEGLARKSLMQLERQYFDGERGLLRTRIQAALELYYADSAVPTPVVPDPGSVPLPEEIRPGDLPRDARPPDAAPPDAAPPDAAPPDAAPPDAAPPDAAPPDAGAAP